MKLNHIGYFDQRDGYGRWNSRLIRALQQAGADVRALHIGELDRPPWLLEQLNIDWSRLTITCAPPFMLQPIPPPPELTPILYGDDRILAKGQPYRPPARRHWLFSMTEGSILPPDWADTINNSGVERVIVPCQHNADAFANSGVTAPISVVHGGTDPAEFPLRTEPRDAAKPYTFLTFADRNERKGWHEVWDAFYLAFGGKTTGTMDVRLLIKYRPDDNNVTTVMAGAVDADKRIVYQGEDVADMAMLYAQADCLVLPSRSEGWGMIHREAACQGLPVITQAYSGLSDAHEWAIVVEKGVMQPIPRERSTSLGEWRVVDVAELAQKMRWCYERPTEAAEFGRQAAAWIRDNQTWTHAASALIDLLNASEVTTQDMHAAYA